MFIFPVVLYLFILLFACLLTTWVRNKRLYRINFTCLRGKTVIITGGNSGVGLYTAIELAGRGARIILACRDIQKAEFAKRFIIQETNNDNVFIHRLDLLSLQSVRNFCDVILQEEAEIDFLINNAGAIHLGDHITEDNFQITWQVNYFAPVLLTNLLLDKIQKSNGSIMNVTGMLCNQTISDEHLNTYWSSKLIMFSDIFTYYQAKSALNNYSVELLRQNKCKVNVFEPNFNGSNFWRRVHLGLIALVYLQLKLFFSNPKDEANKLVNQLLNGVSSEPIVDEFRNKVLWSKTREYLNMGMQ